MSAKITFLWTSAPLLALAKCRTRRDWQESFAKRMTPGTRFEAWNRKEEFGGQKIATLEIRLPTYWQSTQYLDEEDYVTEGFAWMEQHREYWPTKWVKEGISMRERFLQWIYREETVLVVDFEVVALHCSIDDLYRSKAGVKRREVPRPEQGRLDL